MRSLQTICVTRIHGASVVKNSTFSQRVTETRKCHGLCFCTTGKMIYYYDGKEYVSDPTHVLLLPKGASYTSACTEAGEFPLINFYTTEDFAPAGFLSMEIESPDPYMGEFRKLERLCVLSPSNLHLSGMHTFYSLLNRLYKALLAAEETKNFAVIRTAVRYLEDHFDDPALTNVQLAEKAMISEVYFRRLFREKYGTSPKQYICELRIRKAEALLRSEPISITAVAELCGFSGVYHFSRAFKAATGYTPTEYAVAFSEM